MVSNNFCDLDKLTDSALAMFENGELDGVLSKEDRSLLGLSEAKPSTTTTKGECDLDKLIDGALALLETGETGTVSKEARALFGLSEAQPTKTITTKG